MQPIVCSSSHRKPRLLSYSSGEWLLKSKREIWKNIATTENVTWEIFNISTFVGDIYATDE